MESVFGLPSLKSAPVHSKGIVMINWKKVCKGCGKCCGPVPFEISRYHNNKDKVQTKERADYLMFPGFVVLSNSDGWCPFLKANKRCAIYHDRPEVCRLFGTIPELKCDKI